MTMHNKANLVTYYRYWRDVKGYSAEWAYETARETWLDFCGHDVSVFALHAD